MQVEFRDIKIEDTGKTLQQVRILPLDRWEDLKNFRSLFYGIVVEEHSEIKNTYERVKKAIKRRFPGIKLLNKKEQIPFIRELNHLGYHVGKAKTREKVEGTFRQDINLISLSKQYLKFDKLGGIRRLRWDESEKSDARKVFAHESPNTPNTCLLYTSPSPRDRQKSRMPSSA